MKLKVAVIGGGSWGTAVASLVSRNAPTILWARDQQTVTSINESSENSRYLPGIKLHGALRASSSLMDVLRDADVVVMGIPSQNFRAVLEDVRQFLRPWVPVISLTKGLELSTGLRMTQIVEEVLPGHPVGVLTGPNLAREVLEGRAAGAVISMGDVIIMKELQSLFNSGLFRVYTNNDLIGCEIGGVLKNIVAIAVGMGDGLGAGDNTRSALLTRGLAEITRLGVALGGRQETFYGLTGMGDMLATCTSPLSRNRYVGLELGRGRPINEIMAEMKMVAEGVKSAPTVVELARQHGVTMPIAEDVFGVTTGQKTAVEAFRGLIRLKAGSEEDSG